jgi:hypothetical protein
MTSQKKQPKLEPIHLRLGRYLFTVIGRLLLNDYLRTRIWLLVAVLLFFLLVGGLTTKNVLQIILVIVGYVILVGVYKWIENRIEK